MVHFENNVSLAHGLTLIEQDLNDYGDDKRLSFEQWVARRYLPAYAKERGWQVVWPAGQQESFPVIGASGNERQIDVGIIIEKTPDDEAGNVQYKALIAQCYCPDDYTTKPTQSKMREIESAISNLRKNGGCDNRIEFIRELLERNILSPNEGDTYDYDIVDEDSEIQGFFFSLGDIDSAEKDTDSGRTRMDLVGKDYQVIDIQGLAKWKYVSTSPQYVGPVSSKLSMVSLTERKNDAYLGYISAGELYTFFHEDRVDSPYVSGKNHSLLNSNLRYKLPTTGDPSASKIANGIAQTLQDKPEYFHKFNNGIVIVTSGIKQEEEDLILSKPQIVNGGQTTNAIYDFVRKYKATNQGNEPPAFNSAMVPVKIISEDDEILTSDIARYANRQNPIESRDEHSTDHDQENIMFPAFNNLNILWDHKRGLRDTLTGGDMDRYRVRGQTWKEVNNTYAAKFFLASIGDPVSAYTMGDEGIFSRDNLVKFVFSADRSQELQKAASVDCSRLKKGEELIQFPNIREGVEEYVHDTILWSTIDKFCDSIKNKYISEKKKHVRNEITEDEYEVWLERAFALGHWKYAVIMCVNLIVEKHCLDLENGDKVQKRMELRKNLLGGDYTDTEILNKIFETPRNWNISMEIDIENTNHILLNEKCSKTFPLLGYWIYHIEQLISDISKDERKSAKDWKTEPLYNKIKQKLGETLGNPAKLKIHFPASELVDEGDVTQRKETFDSEYKQLLTLEESEDKKEYAKKIIENYQGIIDELTIDEELSLSQSIIKLSCEQKITGLTSLIDGNEE